MAPRSHEQFEEIRMKRRVDIMDAAMHIFAEEGYHSASISKIASRASISKGLVYNYFKSKEELLKEVVFHGTEVMFQALGEGHLIETREDFEKMVDHTFEMLESNIPYWKLYFSIVSQAGVLNMLEDDFRELATPWMMALTHYYKVNGSMDPETDAFFLESLMDGLALNYVMDPKNFPLNKIKKIIIKKFSYNNSRT